METRINNIKCKQMYFKKRGKNLLKNTAVSQTINGVTFTVNEDGSVTVNGTASENTTFLINKAQFEQGLIMSGCPVGGTLSTYYMRAIDESYNNGHYDIGDSISISATLTYNIQIYICKEFMCNNLTFYPMIRLASIADATYEPYEDFVAYKKVYVDGVLVFSAGNPVTYVVDTGVEHTEEVESGASCLSYTPTKSGYTFVGWRKDKTASAEVETNLVMGDEPITLYAVFGKDVTLTYAGNGATSGSTAPDTKTIFYNNGNETEVTFTIKANGFTRSGCTFRGWSLGAVGATVKLTKDTTCNALWKYADKATGTINAGSGESDFSYAIDGTKYKSFAFVYTIGAWGDGNNGLYLKNNSTGAIIWSKECSPYQEYSNLSATVTLPSAQLTLYHTIHNPDARCRIESGTLYGRDI